MERERNVSSKETIRNPTKYIKRAVKRQHTTAKSQTHGSKKEAKNNKAPKTRKSHKKSHKNHNEQPKTATTITGSLKSVNTNES